MFNQHLTTALVHIRRSPYQAIAAILIMSLTFFAATTFGIVSYMMAVTIRYFETSPQIIAFLKNQALPEQISALSRKLSSDPRIRGDVRFVSQEEAFRIFKETADNPLAAELVSPDVLPASLEFSVADLAFAKGVIADVKEEEVVERVEFTASLGGETTISQVIENLQRITRYLRWGGVGLLLFLSLTAVLTLLVVIGMRVAARREEINVLTLIGATAGFIRLPFLLEGLIYATSGALIGFLTGVLLFLYLMPTLSFYFGEIPVVPKDVSFLVARLGILLTAELFAAFLIGVSGAWFAISRYLRL